MLLKVCFANGPFGHRNTVAYLLRFASSVSEYSCFLFPICICHS
ncbi:hypothetical protein [Methanolapillus millepedarum]